MLIVFRLIIFYYFITISICSDDKITENREKEIYTSQGRSYKPDYSSGAVGSYSRGGLYAQSAVTAHHGHESATTEGCNMDELVCLSMASQDRLGLDAIKSLHRQLDDDADGNVDFSESDEFLREDLKYEDGYQRRQQAFHRNDDKHISVRELWDAWLRSEVHNWTVEQTSEWLAMSVELPQYIPTFVEHRVTGATLPRLAVTNSQYLSVVLGIKDPIHKQKIALKAMDVVLFGPPKDFYHPTKDIILITLLLGALLGCWYAYRQNKSSRRHLRRMMKDMESLHKAELALEDLQRELEHAKKEQESVATEKLNLERRLLEQAGDGEGMRISYSDLEVNQLKQEVEMLRSELQRAEGELQDRCWSPPVGLQHWLQLTHEIENKAYSKKRLSAEKQLQQAREACEKLRKKRSSLVGAFVSTHGKSIDDVDRSIVEARTSLNEVTSELQERVYRWKQIELLCGFNIINNNGLQYLESMLYRGAPNGRGLRSLGRMSSSQDDLDEDSGSIYSPSAGKSVASFTDDERGLENWKEDSSGSEQGKNELDDEFQQETRSISGNVHFTLGGDATWPEDLVPLPLPIVPKRQHKSSMVRSYSQDTNVNTMIMDRDREIPTTAQPKLSQSETNLESPVNPPPRPSHMKKLSRDQSLELDDARPMRKIDDQHHRKLPEELGIRRLTKDQPEEDPMVAFIKSVRDWEVPEDERVSMYRKSREAPDDYRKSGSREIQRETFEDFRKTSSDDYRKITSREAPDDYRKAGGGEDSRRIQISNEENRKNIEDFRKSTGLDDYKKSNQPSPDDKDETYSTDSNSTAADDPDTKRKKRKLFGNFRKHKSKLS